MIFLAILFCTLIIALGVRSETVLMTEVFALPIDPPMFNWTYEGIDDQYIYLPSLLNKPDLPSWINYKYSKKHHCGFLYGVPQKHHSGTEIEIVALDQLTYETRRHSFYIHVTEKLNPARHEVQFKLNELSVEDLFDAYRMERLKNIFKRKLWRESEADLYVTFLESSVQLGGRWPLMPNEGEGVVVRLGSRAEFSTELLKLQDELRPLWKYPSCPFKQATVDNIFRSSDFILDWCSFTLLETDGSAMHHQSNNENGEVERHRLEKIDHWKSIAKSEVPVRNYSNELLYTISVPIIALIILIWMLTLILCFHHEAVSKSETSSPLVRTQRAAANNVSYPTTARDAQYDPTADAFIRSRTNSPNSTLARTYLRPSPPPYPAGVNRQEF